MGAVCQPHQNPVLSFEIQQQAFMETYGLTQDDHGNLWISAGSLGVRVLDSLGQRRQHLAGDLFTGAVDIAFAPSGGRAYVAKWMSDVMNVIDIYGKHQLASLVRAVAYSQPASVCVDAQGFVYLGDGHGTLSVFQHDGSRSDWWSVFGNRGRRVRVVREYQQEIYCLVCTGVQVWFLHVLTTNAQTRFIVSTERICAILLTLTLVPWHWIHVNARKKVDCSSEADRMFTCIHWMAPGLQAGQSKSMTTWLCWLTAMGEFLLLVLRAVALPPMCLSETC